MRTPLPERGRPADEVLQQMRGFKAADSDWPHGRVPLFVFKATDELYEFGRSAFFEYFSENALGGARAFPSVKRMEDEVVQMALGLFQAPESARGFMSTGGTESIVQAVQTCRNWNRARRGDPTHRGTLVLSETAHPAFDKGARLMDLPVRRVPVRADLSMDVAGIDAAIDDDTILVVGSAPNFPYGMIDPIAELSELALRRGVWLHVDACVGGYLAPFARQIGRDIPAVVFALPGVVSLSADLHKVGVCPKPASTVFYRDPERAAHHAFDFNGWPNGRFYTNTFVGTRPAGGVAAAWGQLQHLGAEGYRTIAAELMGFVDRYRAGIEAIPGLRVLGRPHLSVVAWGSDEFDVFRVAEHMATQGWLPGLLQKPHGVHRMMSMIHEPSLGEYLAAAAAAVAVVRAETTRSGSGLQATY